MTYSSTSDIESPLTRGSSFAAQSTLWKSLAVIIFLGNVVGQAMQNICLPIALTESGNPDMAVVLVYTAFIYYLFYSILDVVLDVLPESICRRRYVDLNQSELITVGFHNALNGIGAIFGGSSDRTPLTMQMSSSLAMNLAAPFYKMYLFKLSPHPKNFGWRGYAYLSVAALLYFTAFILTLVDKLNNESSGSISPFCLLFILGLFFGITYNVHQEKMMEPAFREFKRDGASVIEYFRLSASLLRRQMAWLFLFTWLSVGLDAIPGFGQTNLSAPDFLNSWSVFLPFGSTSMNLFNLGYIISFITSVFMNRYDSSFNMITSNISAVLSLWTGWVPSLRDDTVGFDPSIPLTVIAMVLSVIAIYPSYLYSVEMKNNLSKHLQSQAELGIKDPSSSYPSYPLSMRAPLTSGVGVPISNGNAVGNVNVDYTYQRDNDVRPNGY